LTDVFVIVTAPQRFDADETAMDIPLVSGTLFVTLMTRWSPGFTWSVGFSNPLGVMKQ
jgi:hypothetical protein